MLVCYGLQLASRVIPLTWMGIFKNKVIDSGRGVRNQLCVMQHGQLSVKALSQSLILWSRWNKMSEVLFLPKLWIASFIIESYDGVGSQAELHNVLSSGKRYNLSKRGASRLSKRNKYFSGVPLSLNSDWLIFVFILTVKQVEGWKNPKTKQNLLSLP